MTTQNYLDLILEPLSDTFTPEFAQRLMNLRANDAVQARIDELRRKANDGTITPSEDQEYKCFVDAVDMISVLQAKAQRFLARRAS